MLYYFHSHFGRWALDFGLRHFYIPPDLLGYGKVAEEEGFEPPVSYPTTVFKTAAFDLSATPPEIQRASMTRWIWVLSTTF